MGVGMMHGQRAGLVVLGSKPANNHVAQSILATLLSLTGAGESPEWANELRPKGAKGVSK